MNQGQRSAQREPEFLARAVGAGSRREAVLPGRGRLLWWTAGLIAEADGFAHRLFRPDAVRYMCADTAMYLPMVTHHDTRRDKKENGAPGPRFRSPGAIFAGGGRCWVRTNVGSDLRKLEPQGLKIWRSHPEGNLKINSNSFGRSPLGRGFSCSHILHQENIELLVSRKIRRDLTKHAQLG